MRHPALWTAVALALGVAAAEGLRPHPALAFVALLLAGAWAVVLRHRRWAGAAALAAAIALFGALLHSYAQTAGHGNLAVWQGDTVTLVATVAEEPQPRSPRGSGYVANVEQVNGRPASGRVYVTQWEGPAPAYGLRVELSGRLKEPTGAAYPGAFDRAAYLARQGVYLTVDTSTVRALGPGRLNPLRRWAVAARLRLEGVLKASLPPRDAALMAGLLFGTRTDLPEDVKAAFKASGVLHLLAVSGGNIAMLVLPLLALLRRAGLTRRAASAAAIPLVVFFVLLTGAGPSVMRAGLMAVLVLLGDVLRRERNALNTLGAAAFILLLWAPGLLFDIGFQLSAGATLGILLFARPLGDWLLPRFRALFGERPGGWLADGLSVTFAAQAVVEPLSLYHFGAMSLIAPVANLLVVAFLEPVVWAGLGAAVAGLFWLPAAVVAGYAVRLGLWLLIFAVRATAAVPYAFLEVGRLPVAGVLVWYGLLAVVVVPACRGAVVRGLTAWRPVAALLVLALLTGWTWRLALAGPPATLEAVFLDVGQGDAILIRAPGGETMLVDAGPAILPVPDKRRPGFDAGAEVVLPYLAEAGIRRVDVLVLTHGDLDHAGGGPAVLAGVPVGAVLHAGADPDERFYTAALDEATRRRVPSRRPVAGDAFRLGAEVVVTVLNPQAERMAGTRSDDNSNCVALRVQYRQVAILLACDLEGAAEERLLGSGLPLRADVLKASHHGSGHSSTQAFLEAVRPRFAVVSAGNGNRYGHPHAGALERLQAVGSEVWRTDRHGTVTVSTDGQTLAVAATRGSPDRDAYRPLGLLGRRLLFAW